MRVARSNKAAHHICACGTEWRGGEQFSHGKHSGTVHAASSLAAMARSCWGTRHADLAGDQWLGELENVEGNDRTIHLCAVKVSFCDDEQFCLICIQCGPGGRAIWHTVSLKAGHLRGHFGVQIKI